MPHIAMNTSSNPSEFSDTSALPSAEHSCCSRERFCERVETRCVAAGDVGELWLFLPLSKLEEDDEELDDDSGVRF